MDCGGGGACGHNSVAIGASRVKGEKWEDVQEETVSLGEVAQHLRNKKQHYGWSNRKGEASLRRLKHGLILFEEMEDTSAEPRWRLQL